MLKKLPHDRQVLVLALLTGLPATLAACWLLWRSDIAPTARWVAGLVLLAAWASLAEVVRRRVARPLGTLSSLLSALREGDFSTQARGAQPGDRRGDVLVGLNALTEILREQRLSALEATVLLRTVMEEINVAVFTFDDRQRVRLTNRAGERLLAQPAERLVGRTAGELGLAGCLEGEPARTFEMTFPGGLGRWGMRRNHFRQGGLPHQLLVLADLSQALREEQRQAWQRLLRVLGHDLIKRVAGLETRLPLEVVSGPDLTLQADGDQLEQLLINLVRNATDAALETQGGVRITWAKAGSHLQVQVKDEGPGLSNTANLFVPFFTKKSNGSGIGLVLSRQIAEAHGGSLTLENRTGRPGCVARLRLPVA